MVTGGHVPYEIQLSKTGHNFFAIQGENILPWNQKHGLMPQNYTTCDKNVMRWLDIDCVVLHNPLAHINHVLHLLGKVPVICIFHTCSPPSFNKTMWNQYPLNLTKNLFITDYAKISWGNKDGRVINHAIDTKFFKPLTKKRQVLTTCNDFLGRAYEYGFDVYRYIRSKLEHKVDFVLVGDSPGLSKPANSREEMAKIYGESLIYLSTHVVSPIPFSLLEAASAGCVPVTSACCSTPDYFSNGIDALIYGISHPDDAVDYINHILDDEKAAQYYGQNARRRMIDLDENRFIREWNEVFYDD